MANVLAFPARGTFMQPTCNHWATYTVAAYDSLGDAVVLTVRALSADSAHIRARRDGYDVKSVERTIG